MADAGSAVTPEGIAQLRCPRCWFAGAFYPYGASRFRCSRCEWKFTLAAATVATPAVPASTVAAVNGTGTVVAVTISGGTLTYVYVNGAQAGTTAGLYHVPVGGTISVTYSAAPTWAWALPALSAPVAAGGTALAFAPAGSNTAFAQGQVLIVDTAGTADIVTAGSGPSATSVPVGALGTAHASGALVSVAQVTPSHPGQQSVPQDSY